MGGMVLLVAMEEKMDKMLTRGRAFVVLGELIAI